MNAHGAILTAAYNLLDGNVPGMNGYKSDVPESETGNYYILRIEGGTGNNNKRSINDNMILITDLVTVFENNVNSDVVDEADAAVFDLIVPNPQANTLSASGLQALNVSRESFNYLQESDGVKQYYRKVSRYSMRIHQTI